MLRKCSIKQFIFQDGKDFYYPPILFLDLLCIEYKILIHILRGKTESSTLSDQQLQAKLKVENYLDDNFCKQRDWREYCTIGLINNTNVCKGDSGSGMVYPINGRWYIYGLVSHAMMKIENGEMKCNNIEPSFHTMVPKYLDWIQRAMKAKFTQQDFFISFL